MQIHRSCDKLESQFGNVSLDIGGIEGQLLEHEASKQAVLELLKFAQNESASIVTKIKEQVCDFSIKGTVFRLLI